jgi:hypothetical protein
MRLVLSKGVASDGPASAPGFTPTTEAGENDAGPPARAGAISTSFQKEAAEPSAKAPSCPPSYLSRRRARTGASSTMRRSDQALAKRPWARCRAGEPRGRRARTTDAAASTAMPEAGAGRASARPGSASDRRARPSGEPVAPGFRRERAPFGALGDRVGLASIRPCGGRPIRPAPLVWRLSSRTAAAPSPRRPRSRRRPGRRRGSKTERTSIPGSSPPAPRAVQATTPRAGSFARARP